MKGKNKAAKSLTLLTARNPAGCDTLASSSTSCQKGLAVPPAPKAAFWVSNVGAGGVTTTSITCSHYDNVSQLRVDLELLPRGVSVSDGHCSIAWKEEIGKELSSKRPAEC